jgi:hypothetical protein
MSDSEYLLQKVEEMMALAATSREERAKREFERLAEEYKALAQTARRLAQPKRA